MQKAEAAHNEDKLKDIAGQLAHLEEQWFEYKCSMDCTCAEGINHLCESAKYYDISEKSRKAFETWKRIWENTTDTKTSALAKRELTQRCVRLIQEEGDKEAFAMLLRLYRPSLIGLYMFRIGVLDDNLVCELVQEAFIRAWKSIGKLKDPTRFEQWLLTIGKNVFMDWCRKNNREHNNLEEYIKNYRRSHGDSIKPSKLGELFEEIGNKIEDPLNLRILYMYYIENYTDAEIGKALELKAETVKRRRERTLQKLRDEFKNRRSIS